MPDDTTSSAPLRFGPFELDVARRLLRRDGDEVALEPQVFDVLVCLIARRDRVVTRDELFEVVWGHGFVSLATLTSRIRDLRAAVGDTGRSQHVIRTVRGRGFQFVAEVETGESSAGSRPSARATAGQPVRTPPTPLLGRSDDVAELRRRLESSRIVTLVGPGGIGKTHLAQHALADDERSPAWFCDLAPVHDPSLLSAACLDAIGALPSPGADPIVGLLEALDGWSCTLVLDNCEHLVDAVADLVAQIIGSQPDVRVVATSRQPLRLRGEHVIRLGALDQTTSTELFTTRAAAHGVELDPVDPEVTSICRDLDGLPLALELAASKTRAYPLGLLRELLADRFDLLTTDARDEVEHHRSLHATISWSFELLTSPQRRSLARMSVFDGPFGLAAARSVCADPDGDAADTAANLVELVDQSLVVFDRPLGRYRLLESIRTFASGELPDRDEVRRRHLDHHLQLVETADDGSVYDGIDRAFSTMRSSWTEIRAAFWFAVGEGDVASAARIVNAVAAYAEMSYGFEVIDWTTAVADLDDGMLDTTARTRLTAVGAALLSHRGEYERAAEQLAPLPDAPTDSRLDLARFWLAYFTGDTATAESLVTELLQRHDGTGDYVEALALTLAHYLAKGADRAVDPQVVERVSAFSEASGEIGEIAHDLCAAIRLDWDDRPDEALAALAELIGRGRRLNYRLLVGGASTARSIILGMNSDAELGARGLLASLRTYADDRMWSFAVADLAAVALALGRRGDVHRAVMLLGARTASGYRGDVSEVVAETAEAELRSAVGDRFDGLVSDGAALSPRAAAELALERLAAVSD